MEPKRHSAEGAALFRPTALAGIVIAFSTSVLGGFDQAIGNWAAASNPLFAGP